ncbi:hypothetical protein RvY_18915 [Ramazzottius varieornatus]|uniref:Uncharacterized protein n=1 Tax=Ramazzottius varieornatus TaxID=947166 RepID=A0A1D1W7J3_RAMVA|nr:hypothetical protein RvY_18915 [Ramazzottius varieornatus]
MGNDRLNGITLTNVHKEYRIDHKQVAQKYLERPLGNLPLPAEPTREINLADMEDTVEINKAWIKNFMGWMRTTNRQIGSMLPSYTSETM